MADKSKSIKEATDQELNDIIFRLRKECEVQDLVSTLKRKSTNGYVSYDNQQGVSTETAIESMYHFGISGMHWHQKKGTTTSEDHNNKVAIKKKKVSAMSNAELKALTTRLQLEKQYKDLTKSELSPGQKFVTELLVNSAKQTASTYMSKYASKGMDQLMTKVTHMPIRTKSSSGSTIYVSK